MARKRRKARHPVLYVLHSSNMYGTERMALATAQGLADDFETIFIGPRGPFLPEATKLGFETHQYRTSQDLAKVLHPLLNRFDSLTFVGTGPRYHLVCNAVNLLHWRKIKHIQMVHAGAGEKKDYARKKLLNLFDITFVVVSDWSRQKLLEYGVTNPVEVVGNFMTDEQLEGIPKRPRYYLPGYRKAVIVSRVDPIKRVDLLLDALDRRGSELSNIEFRVLGLGPLFEPLRDRARATHPNVEFVGYCDDVAKELASADLLVHTCGVESFGLAVLEAMAARLAALVPNSGGTANLIGDGGSGFTFEADDADDLGEKLVALKTAPVELLNRVAANAADRVEGEFGAAKSLEQYRKLFAPV
jgi:glycosyltransferase involved in cell wall biosynthesis